MEEKAPEVEVQENPKLNGHDFSGWFRGVAPVFRRTKERDHSANQLKLYSPCSCGSGKKYKWCCKGKDKFVLNTDAG